MTKTNVERTLETLVEFADIHRQSLKGLTEGIEAMNTHLGERIERLGQKMEEGNQRLVNRIDDLAVQIGNQAEGLNRLEHSVNRLSDNIDRMSSNIDRMNSNLDQRLTQLATSLDGHLRLSESQTANIAELTRLATKLLDKVA